MYAITPDAAKGIPTRNPDGPPIAANDKPKIINKPTTSFTIPSRKLIISDASSTELLRGFQRKIVMPATY